MFELSLLPARQGDAIWIKWGDVDKPHQIMVDMGTEGVGENIRQRIEMLEQDKREFELLVVTHVDRDHIGGVLTCLAEAEPLPGLDFNDIWFNGWVHLDGGKVTPTDSNSESGLESFGPAQGERLSTWLRKQNWNKAFGGNPVCRKPGQPLRSFELADDMKLTVLGPTPERLLDFKPKWKEEVLIALAKGNLDVVPPGLETFGSSLPPNLMLPTDLKELADKNSGIDDSEANGSSIALLLEYKSKRVLLSGDAYASDLIEGISTFTDGQLLDLDAFKLPHHGSKKNISKELIESVNCGKWIFSTDGTQFKHPDDVAIARTVSYSKQQPPKLLFNVPSDFNGWWDNDNWKKLYGYEVCYGTKEDGLKLSFVND
jgi:hypothetical protein